MDARAMGGGGPPAEVGPGPGASYPADAATAAPALAPDPIDELSMAWPGPAVLGSVAWPPAVGAGALAGGCNNATVPGPISVLALLRPRRRSMAMPSVLSRFG